MSKLEEKTDSKKANPPQTPPYEGRGRKTADSKQMAIDDYIAELARDTLPTAPAEGSCNVAPQLRGILCEVIRESKKSRDEIADLMSDSLGNDQTITRVQIDSWKRTDSDRHIPLEYIFAFETTCQTTAITSYLCKLHGGKFIDQRSSDVMDLGQLQVLKTQLAAKERELKRDLSK